MEGLAALERGESADAERFFDQAILALERSTGKRLQLVAHDPYRVGTATGKRGPRPPNVGICGPDSVSVSKDGRYLAVGNASALRLFDLFEGTSLGLLAEARAPVALSPSRPRLVCRRGEDFISTWDLEPLRRLNSLGRVALSFLQYSPDGDRLLAGYENAWAGLVSPTAWSQELIGQDEVLRAAAFTQDGKLLATGSEREEIRLWNVDPMHVPAHQSIPLVKTIGADRVGSPSSLSFSPDGRLLAIGWSGVDVEGFHHVWDVESNEPVPFPQLGRYVESVAFSLDGKLLAAGHTNNKLVLLSVSSGEVLHVLDHSPHVGIHSITFLGAGAILVSACVDTLDFWSVSSGELLLTLRSLCEEDASVAYTPHGQVEFLGADSARIRSYASCRVGDLVFPFELCARRFEVKGLMKRTIRQSSTTSPG